jgi:hypothetical protein
MIFRQLAEIPQAAAAFFTEQETRVRATLTLYGSCVLLRSVGMHRTQSTPKPHSAWEAVVIQCDAPHIFNWPRMATSICYFAGALTENSDQNQTVCSGSTCVVAENVEVRLPAQLDSTALLTFTHPSVSFVKQWRAWAGAD